MAEEQAGKEIYRLIPKVMAAIGAIGKERRNTQGQGYNFRGIDDVYNSVQGPMIESGVFCVPQVIEQKREERTTKNGGNLIYTILTVRHTFFATDGSSVEATTVGEAFDSGDKSSNKAMSAAMKYAMLEVFCIPTEGDNDTENHSPEPKPRQQKQAPATAEPDLSTKSGFFKAYAKAMASRPGKATVKESGEIVARLLIALKHVNDKGEADFDKSPMEWRTQAIANATAGKHDDFLKKIRDEKAAPAAA